MGPSSPTTSASYPPRPAAWWGANKQPSPSGLGSINHQGVLMDMYLRMRRAGIATVCACSAVAGVGMAAGPGSALALPVVNCAAITGSGSSLQAEQQTLWTSLVGTVGFLLKINKLTEECSPGNPAISYTATSSGKGLAEFGAGTSVLEPKEAGNAALKLDAYIGTDDPPTKAQLGEMKVEAGTAAWTT